MYTATIEWNGQRITDNSLHNLYSQMNSMLRVDGPCSLIAKVKSGEVIFASLYEGESYILNNKGHNILGGQ